MEFALILIIIMALPFLFGALRDSGRFQVRRKSSFRQYPTFPPDGEE